MPTKISPFPLERVTRLQLKKLAQFLWSWPPCDDCTVDQPCAAEQCPHHRLSRLEPFFDYYKDLTASYDPDIKADDRAALETHEDLIALMQKLRSHASNPRSQMPMSFFPQKTPNGSASVKADQENAIDLAAKVMLMINCSTPERSPALVEHGLCSGPWLSTISLTDFVTENFPRSDHPNINDNDDWNKSANIKSALMARKLRKRTGMKFHPTDDLRCHLKLNRRNGTVEIFHHTAFLKEHLRMTMERPIDEPQEFSLNRGALPRQLALETLDSIQKILFPIRDDKSRALLRSLIYKNKFDPDCDRFESASIRKPGEKDISYYYLGTRLIELFEESENPTPKGIGKWFERKSGARYVMMATLVGVIIAILLGVVSLAVSSYQTWIAYQQWQHPISSN